MIAWLIFSTLKSIWKFDILIITYFSLAYSLACRKYCFFKLKWCYIETIFWFFLFLNLHSRILSYSWKKYRIFQHYCQKLLENFNSNFQKGEKNMTIRVHRKHSFTEFFKIIEKSLTHGCIFYSITNSIEIEWKLSRNYRCGI